MLPTAGCLQYFSEAREICAKFCFVKKSCRGSIFHRRAWSGRLFLQLCRFIKILWQDATLFCLLFIFYNIHSFNNIHTIHSSVVIRRGLSLSISSLLVSSVEKTSLWCRAENRTQACLLASRRAIN